MYQDTKQYTKTSTGCAKYFFLLPFKGKQNTGAVINNVEIELVVIRCKCMTLIVFPPTVICDMYFFTTNENKDN